MSGHSIEACDCPKKRAETARRYQERYRAELAREGLLDLADKGLAPGDRIQKIRDRVFLLYRLEAAAEPLCLPPLRIAVGPWKVAA